MTCVFLPLPARCCATRTSNHERTVHQKDPGRHGPPHDEGRWITHDASGLEPPAAGDATFAKISATIALPPARF